jgi:membrane-associated phospholipid phosphatase
MPRMKLVQVLAAAVVLAFPGWCAAQAVPAAEIADSQAAAAKPLMQPDAFGFEPVEPAPVARPFNKGFYLDGWKQLGPKVFQDQARMWAFPFSVAHGKHLTPVVAVAAATIALIGIDHYSTGYFYRTDSFQGFNNALSGPNTALYTELFPAAMYAIGLARRDKYAQETFYLAGRAVIDSEILTSVMKDLDRRAVIENNTFTNSWFMKDEGHYLGGKGSFPSGHMIAAFAVATTYAKRYPNPAWHKWVAYGLAGLVGFSRVSIHSHYASDVFAAGALGYAITNYLVVNHP